MTEGIKTVLYPVQDLSRAKAFYNALAGQPPTNDYPVYVGYSIGGQEIGLVPAENADWQEGPLPFWQVADINASLGALAAAGATVHRPVRDVGGGRLVAVVKDADGNPVGLMQG